MKRGGLVPVGTDVSQGKEQERNVFTLQETGTDVCVGSLARPLGPMARARAFPLPRFSPYVLNV